MSPIRLALPLASLTAVGMLASDLYLPSVPFLPADLGGSLTAAQATLAAFMAALALSQLLWGWASDRYGARPALLAGMVLLTGASVLCALAPNMAVLIAGRVVQGLGAGASTVVVPMLLRQRFQGTDAVRAISLVAIAESLVPAFGPVAGAALLSAAGWRPTFWIIAALTLLFAPVVWSVTDGNGAQDARKRGTSAAPAARLPFAALLGNVLYRRFAFSYALMFGALMLFVASAPQLVTGWMRLPVSAFGILQLFGVAAFILAASNGGRLAERLGMDRAIRIGARLQFVACTGFLLSAVLSFQSFAALAACSVVFCAGLGLRGPSTMASALSAASGMEGKGSGVLMFLAFGASSAATLLAAPLLTHGLLPVAAGMALMVAGSIALLPRTALSFGASQASLRQSAD